MGLLIKIIVSIILIIVIIFFLFVVFRSCNVMKQIWSEGIDAKATIDKIVDKLTSQINFVIFKNKMAIYLDNKIIAFTQDEPIFGTNDITFSTIYHNDRIDELKTLKSGDTIEFRNTNYIIISLHDPAIGQTGERIVNMMRNQVVCKKIN